jgi:UPF0716 protein FxsA
MGFIFLLIFVGFPTAEIWLLMKVGSVLGFWDTFFLLVFSAFFGSYLAKMQGAAVLQKMQRCMSEGRLPAAEMLDGMLIFLGGILFIIPGFISDGIGLLLIFPPTRWGIKWLIVRNMSVRFTGPQGPVNSEGVRVSAGRASRASTPEGRAKPVSRGIVEDAEIVGQG